MRQKYPKFTPCVRKCCLNEEDMCLGCFRLLEEILAWHHADEDQKQVIIAAALQRKAAYHAGVLSAK
ncbi:DUF1289 domain-containing protein [Shewanella gelidii]|uniref:DUF1289 domain-containing protein n=1 Tax=Shewanella gelidii TaxID=1642821 RepID=A0A917JV09_9GAMM|nr:DUF1289 domain-containing protein [Shewanella gelidii]MCL1098652.1 DUF1289 domain-containing protein [Shewanella gelidii]GGI86332.1 hypothetical protein GCM10009332_24580 [Shewanella gelidii]